jgi:NAD(P) transhydrogenase subunit beta
MGLSILSICYLIGSVTFILGLKLLSNPASARRGNRIAAGGMTIAIFGTIFLYKDEAGSSLHNYGWIFGGLIIGAIFGTVAAKKVKMTAMPEMVSLFNGMGGACAALISLVEFNHLLEGSTQSGSATLTNLLAYTESAEFTLKIVIILAGLIIGSVSFAGSMIAWGKLNGKIKDFTFKGQHLLNLVLFAFILGLAVYLSWAKPESAQLLLYLIFGLSILYGVMFVLPIGGADMPVVISCSTRSLALPPHVVVSCTTIPLCSQGAYWWALQEHCSPF